jgi:ParB-like chromosome segregation protein Spo0J
MPLSQLVIDERCQAREGLDAETVKEYARLYSAGVDLGPLKVFMVGDEPVVIDGFHRFAAAKRAPLARLPVVVVGEGTIEDAQWMAVSQNTEHGKPLTNDDKRKMVRVVLAHPRSEGMSNRAIERHLNLAVSRETIARIRRGGEPRPGEQMGLPQPRVDVVELRRKADEDLDAGNYAKAEVIYQSALALAPVEMKAEIKECLRLCDEGVAPSKRERRIRTQVQQVVDVEVAPGDLRLEVSQYRCSVCGLPARTTLTLGWTNAHLCPECIEALRGYVSRGPVQQSGARHPGALLHAGWPDALGALLQFVAGDDGAEVVEAEAAE